MPNNFATLCQHYGSQTNSRHYVVIVVPNDRSEHWFAEPPMDSYWLDCPNIVASIGMTLVVPCSIYLQRQYAYEDVHVDYWTKPVNSIKVNISILHSHLPGFKILVRMGDSVHIPHIFIRMYASMIKIYTCAESIIIIVNFIAGANIWVSKYAYLYSSFGQTGWTR